MIHSDAQRGMSKRAGSKVVDVKGSRFVDVSQPEAMADFIAKPPDGEEERGASLLDVS